MAGSEGAGAPPVGGSAGASGGEAAGGTSAGGTAAGGSSGGSSCTRESLEAAVDVYLTALAAHDPSGASIASTAKYTENTETVMVGEGLWQTAGEAKLVRTLIDAEQCSSFSEVVLPEDGADSVMAVRLTHAAGSISEIEAIITRQGDWLFSAQGFLDSADQKWDILPEAERSTREELIEAPRSYYEYFEANEELPAFGPGCERLEGGQMVVGCPVGFPSGVSIGNRRYWADVEAGVSVAVALFGGDDSGLLDVHFFRMVESTIRNVHSLTVDSTFTTTGWPMGESADE
jgi:hypothetical protein